MEELKHEQELRERRNQEREHWRDGRPSENSAVCAFNFGPTFWCSLADTVHLSEWSGCKKESDEKIVHFSRILRYARI